MSRCASNDSLAAKRTSLAVDDRTIGDEVRVEHDARMLAAQQRLQGALASFNRLATQILAVESAVRRRTGPGAAVLLPADQVEYCGSPFSSQAMASPSIMQERADKAATAAVASGKRLAKSWPFRERS